MSKRHHATRRRVYGRRQHELHQRQEIAVLSAWNEVPEETPDRANGADRRTGRDGRVNGTTFGFGD